MCKHCILVVAILVCILCISACAPAQAPRVVEPTTPEWSPPDCAKAGPSIPIGPEAYEVRDAVYATVKALGREPPPEDILKRFEMRGEVILLGDLSAIEAVRREANICGIQLDEVDQYRTDFGHLGTGWQMRLYILKDRDTKQELPSQRVGQVVAIAYTMPGKYGQVQAEPNYLVVPSLVPTIQGSPWYIDGSPNLNQTMAADKTAFDSQWAFTGNYGIHLPASQPGLSGHGITVHLFDTDATGSNPPSSCDISSHGQFVKSLVAKVAPKSTIETHVVLGECGEGKLVTLQKELAALKSLFVGSEPPKAVLNLSLFVHRNQKAFGLDADQIAALGYSSATKISTQAALVPQLQNHLSWLSGRGAVIVASAGNDPSGATTSDMLYPAAYDFVVGVAASNDMGDRSCYSYIKKTQGPWLMAPGGDGRDPSAPGSGCQPRVAQCAKFDTCPNNVCSKGTCGYGVVGQVPPNVINSGYAYWVGTSFAAPLVSGLAAVVLEAKANTWTGASVAQNVFTIMQSNAVVPTIVGFTAGGRIINVADTIKSLAPQ